MEQSGGLIDDRKYRQLTSTVIGFVQDACRRSAIQVPWSAISLCHLAAGAGIQRPCFR